MKCELKTLKGATFSVEVEPDTSVAKVKELAAASEPGVKDGWEVGNIKLIHQGKVALFHGDGDLVSAASPLQMLPSLARSLFFSLPSSDRGMRCVVLLVAWPGRICSSPLLSLPLGSRQLARPSIVLH